MKLTIELKSGKSIELEHTDVRDLFMQLSDLLDAQRPTFTREFLDLYYQDRGGIPRPPWEVTCDVLTVARTAR